MSERPVFQQQQYAFAAHIRNPHTAPAPEGIEDRRMAIYRDLFFNNVEKLLAKSFPVIHTLLGEERWVALVRDYFSTHQASTPYFLEVPQEFLLYLQEERGARTEDQPFLVELAHYEWVELAVSVLSNDGPADVAPDGDLIDGVPVASHAAWSVAYQFDVHNVGLSYQPDTAPEQPTFLVVYRRPDFSMGFLEINAVSARLIELIKRDDGATGRELLTRIATEIKHPNPAVVVEGGVALLEQLRQHHIVLGARRASDQINEQREQTNG
ncbi:MAG: DUF2063 domain-containing protein [Gammaproteobacteria bacterium]